MKHFEIIKDKDVCGIGVGFAFNRLYDRKYTHTFEIVVLYWSFSFVWETENKIGK